MGIPRFYRWLSERYPQINQRLDENVGQMLPQFDNMYLDANGIIHNCSHPNDDLKSNVKLSLEEMATQMCAYIDRMVQLIRPERVLFIAIDGCAPRAKMNQQRCRRFATARDAALAHEGLSQQEIDEMFDSNQITPGTQFMADLGHYFEFFFRYKIRSDPLYSKLKVVFSGNNVPGEGEHKIMDYIRRTSSSSASSGDGGVETRHCLVGLDADLICLALASHMPHFALLREAVNFQAFRQAQKQNATKEVVKQITEAKFELLRVSTLREYIALEYLPYVKNKDNMERVIDDWVLMIMLVGNDFLPPLPSMDIFEGGLDSMLELHKDMLLNSGDGDGGFLVHRNASTGRKEINFAQLEVLFRKLGAMEERVFAAREVRLAKERGGGGGGRHGHLPHSNVSLVQAEVEEELDSGSSTPSPSPTPPPARALTPEELDRQESKRRRTRYYAQKFGVAQQDGATDGLITQVVDRYVQGLNWVFHYYYFGVPSWNWFFPFHYSPLCSDLKNLAARSSNAQFDMGQPFPPFCQLLACLPANSAKFLPRALQQLMTDEHSPLAEFYPKTWQVDENGKRNPWEFVNLLPFIDEARLFAAVAAVDLSQLTEAELARNRFGDALVFEQDLGNHTEVVRSPFTLHFSQTLHPALTSRKVFVLPEEEEATGFASTQGKWKLLLSDSSLSAHPRLVPAQCHLKPIKLNTFGSPSQKCTLVLKFASGAAESTIEAFVEQHSSAKCCWINYPHLNEARMVSVVDCKQRRAYSFETQTWVKTTEFPLDEIKVELDKVVLQAKLGGKVAGTGGMEFDAASSAGWLAVRVRTLCEVREDAVTGRFEKKYSQQEFVVPAEMLVFDFGGGEQDDSRFVQQEVGDGAGEEVVLAVPLSQRFPVGVEAVCVGDKGYGMVGQVHGYTADGDEAVLVEFPKLARPVGNEFARSLAVSLQDKYFSLSDMAKRANLPISVVDKFLGSLKVWQLPTKPGDKKSFGKPVPVDLGLNLRVGKGYVVPGYARFLGGGGNVVTAWKSGDSVVRVAAAGGGGVGEGAFADTRNAQGNLFEYSQAALDLLVLYQTKFPQLFQRVISVAHKQQQNNAGGGDFQGKDLFAGGANGASDSELVLTWLRQIPSYSVPLVPISSSQMSRSAVDAVDLATKELKRVADSAAATASGAGGAGVVVVPVLPHLLRKNPKYNRGQMLSPTALITPPLLGDRVINLTNVLIPFGLPGVVVATHPTSGAVQVVFEDAFVGGTTLAGLCRAGHGALLPYIQVLNLTQRGAVSSDPTAPMPSNAVVPPSRDELRQLQLQALANRQQQQATTPLRASAAGKKPVASAIKKPAASTPQPAATNLTWNAPPPVTVQKLKQQTALPRASPMVASSDAAAGAAATGGATRPAKASSLNITKPVGGSASKRKAAQPVTPAAAPAPAAVSATPSNDDTDDLANYFFNLMSTTSAPAAAAPAPVAAAPVAAPAPPAAVSSSAASLARVEALFKRAQEQGANKHDTD